VIQTCTTSTAGSELGWLATVVTFQPRMAIRQVGKGARFSAELLDRLAKGVDRCSRRRHRGLDAGRGSPADMRPQSWPALSWSCAGR